MKFIGFKYWLNEKFTEDSDPIRDIGIGLYTERTFSSWKKFYEWFYEVAPYIAKVKDPTELVKDMNNMRSAPFLVDKYYSILNDYFKKYIKISYTRYPEKWMTSFDPYTFKEYIIKKERDKNRGL
jgi:hypothetical protein